ncbi:MAG TPA: helix-turn-helix domain-containing protein [Solirubrobacteraceae bacterium]|nr:helix-turn-helix domain-containing protein [Solirubrobacteraceae bacterium]
MPNYGKNQRPGDVIPDWLLGGNRKRLLLAELVENPKALGAQALAEHLGCGRSTAFETIRALRALDMIEQDESRGVRLVASHELTKAIKIMLDALGPFADHTVDRPPRRRQTG